MMRSLKLAATTGMGISLASFAPGGALPAGMLAPLPPAMAANESCTAPTDRRALIQRLLISSAVAAPVGKAQRIAHD